MEITNFKLPARVKNAFIDTFEKAETIIKPLSKNLIHKNEALTLSFSSQKRLKEFKKLVNLINYPEIGSQIETDKDGTRLVYFAR